VATRSKYRKLTNDQWAELEPILTVERIGAGRPPANPRQVFNTLLFMLWEERTYREVPKRGYAPAPVTTRMLWKWAEDGRLELAWDTYLDGLPKRQIASWRALFKKYQESWKSRTDAQRYAGRVHSLWFQKMHRVLTRHRS
jgi:hypothetical protein